MKMNLVRFCVYVCMYVFKTKIVKRTIFFALALTLSLSRYLIYLPTEERELHMPAKQGSQIASAAHSYCKQFDLNFSRESFWPLLILNSFFVSNVSTK